MTQLESADLRAVYRRLAVKLEVRAVINMTREVVQQFSRRKQMADVDNERRSGESKWR